MIARLNPITLAQAPCIKTNPSFNPPTTRQTQSTACSPLRHEFQASAPKSGLCGCPGTIPAAFSKTVTWSQVRPQLNFGGRQSIAAAFVISMLIHAALYGGWKWGSALGLWDHQATWLLRLGKERPKPTPVPDQAVEITGRPTKEIPLTFIEVDPVTATPDPPEETTFYGAQNSKAANPEPSTKSDVPKADGTQKEVPRLADVPRDQPDPTPLEPAPLEPAKTEPTPPETSPGDLAKADTFLTPTDAKPDPREKAVVRTRPRPRTLEEARNRLGLAGRKIKQDGGVRRPGQLSFDVKATEFGSYDAAFIAAVQKRWYDLIDNHSTQTVPRSGKVVVEFRLTYEGRISEMKTGHNEVGEILGLLCQRAIMDPAPYATWPSDMRRKMGNFRDVTFTFYYN